MTALDDVRDEAVLGSYCPKMCNFACPVASATGREADTPWGLHVTVSSAARDQRRPDADRYRDLTGCTGCHACRDACLYELDVPAQVRAARAHHDPGQDGSVRRVLAAIAEGRTPYGEPPLELEARDGPSDLQVVLGCRDGSAVADAVTALFTGTDVAVRVLAPDGCCGAILADLGLPDRAAELRRDLAEKLDPGLPTTAVDPHCLTSLRAIVDAPVEDSLTTLARLLDEGRLRLDPPAEGRSLTYHDPCVLARDEGTVDAPRQLLQAAGYTIDEPLAHGRRTACSGAGMAMDLLDPGAAAAVAGRRAEQLAATDSPVATACGRARAIIESTGRSAQDIHVVLARHVEGPLR